MEIFGCTYKEYIKKYENRLGLYVERYEDRTESVFLEKELVNFKDFYNVLVSIHNSIVQHKNHINLINDVQFKNHLTYLQNNYNNVFKELFTIGPPILDAYQEVEYQDDIEEEDVCGHIIYFDVTKEKLDNLIVSTKRILGFINNKKSKLQKSRTPEIEEEAKGSIITEETKPHKPLNFSAKWYALAYLLELKMKGLKPPINTEGDFVKSELEEIGRKRTGKSGQGFYRSVSKYYKDLKRPDILSTSFGKDWKDTILKLINGNNALKDYIEKHY